MKEIYESDEVPIDVFELKEAIKATIELYEEYGGDSGTEYDVAEGPHYQIKVHCDVSEEKDAFSLDMEVWLHLLPDDEVDIDLLERSIQFLRELESRKRYLDAYEGVVEVRWEIADSVRLDRQGKKIREFEKVLKSQCKEMEGMLKGLSSKKKRRRKRSDDE